jgi:hypothetical protein
MATGAAIGAVIMVGGAGSSPQEQLVLAAQRASTLDLITMLRHQGIDRIVVAAPTTNWLPGDLDVIRVDDPPDEAFHFGRRLAALIETYAVEPVLYFGGGSAPLVDAAAGGMLVGIVDQAARRSSATIPSHIVLTNNLHSSDWAVISRTAEALPLIRQAGRDNSLAWVLRESGEYEVRVFSGLRPATAMDIDTPADLAVLARHPSLQPALRAVVGDARLSAMPVEAVLRICAQEGKTLALIGRVSPLAWQALNRATRIWTRVIAEERGMVASERLARGEVRSVLVPWIEARGFDGFFADLAGMADAAIFDSRVLFAATGLNPNAADRFAADLLWADSVSDPWLHEFTCAAARAPIPIIFGGHNVVSGGLHALVEILEYRASGAAPGTT